jgi:hypothetical protein
MQKGEVFLFQLGQLVFVLVEQLVPDVHGGFPTRGQLLD